MFRKSLIATALASLCATGAWAAVSADEAKQLGTTLTQGIDQRARSRRVRRYTTTKSTAEHGSRIRIERLTRTSN